MKKMILFFMGLFTAAMLFAQSPDMFNYQAVVRDATGAIKANQSVKFRISILEGSFDGAVVLQETHPVSTNEFGLVNLEIGNGYPVSGNMASINWGSNTYYLKVELDPTGGTSFINMGTSQLMSVPYAFHAKTVQIDQVNDADADPANEIQELQLSGTQLTLSKGGGTVTLPSTGGGDNWGTQVVLTDATLTGGGITASPLKLAQQGATNGQALKWNGTTWAPAVDLVGTSLWQRDGSKIYFDGGRVGIGTSDPQSELHVNAMEDVFSAIQFTNDASGKYANDGFIIGLQYQTDYPSNRYGLILNQEDTPLRIGTSNAQYQLSLIQNGNVGIGIPIPGAKLEVAGQVKITGGNPGPGKVLTSDAGGLASWQAPSGGLTLPYAGNSANNNVLFQVVNTGLGDAISGASHSNSGIGIHGLNSSTSGSTFGVFAEVKSSAGFAGYFKGGKVYVEGNVGIGNPNPEYKLDVTGNRIRLLDESEWIAMRTDGNTGFLDLSFSGGKLVIQGSAANEHIIINPSMNKVGIRTWTPQYELDVNGSIRATGSVYYGGTTDGANGTAYIKPDFVFEEDYERFTIDRVEDFLSREKHLPWVTSAKQEKIENGPATDMTRMAFETLESVENVQLQVIGQAKRIKELEDENDLLKERLARLENHMAAKCKSSKILLKK